MIRPPATLGILGGGQLGRYFVDGRAHDGLPDDRPRARPACARRHGRRRAPRRRLRRPGGAATPRLGVRCRDDRVRESSVDSDGMAQRPDRRCTPRPAAVAIAQDREREKAFLSDAGIPLAPFAVIETDADIVEAIELRLPGNPQDGPHGLRRQGSGRGCRTRRVGDGVGTARPPAMRVGAATDTRRRGLGGAGPDADGEIAIYPTAHNTHVDGILDCTVVRAFAAPATPMSWPPRSPTLSTTSVCWPWRCSSSAVDCWSTSSRPRPHNSGHWTLDAGAHQPVRAAGARGMRCRPRRSVVVGAGCRDGQPARRPVGRRRAGLVRGPGRSRCVAAPVRQGVSAGRAARWATSRSPQHDPTRPSSGRGPSDPD